MTRPWLAIGHSETQDAHVSFQVVDGISENILSINRAVDQGATFHFSSSESWMEWPDGARADFRREGNQFVLPYRELTNSGGSGNAQSRVAPVEIPMDDVEAQEVEAFAQRELQAAEDQAEWAELAGQDQEEPVASEQRAEVRHPQPRAPPSPAEPSPQERARHMLTHLPYQAWCPDCLSGKGRENPHTRHDCDAGVQKMQMDYLFFGRDGELVENEAALVTVLVLTDRVTGLRGAQRPRTTSRGVLLAKPWA